MSGGNELEDLANRTFSDNDDSDSTFVPEEVSATSSTINSSHEELHSEDDPSKSQNDPLSMSLQDTLPILSASESEQPEPNASSKSIEITFESTVDEQSTLLMTDYGSTSSLNDDSHAKVEPNGKLPISTAESEHSDPKVSTSGIISESVADKSSETQAESNEAHNVAHDKESLNQFSDPTDSLIAKLVDFEKGKKTNSEGNIID